MNPRPPIDDVADGRVPRGWMWCALVAAALAAGYWLWTGPLHLSPAPLERYLAERAAALDSGEPVTEQTIAELAGDKLALRAGAAAFERHCAKCHGARGEGAIGPNLTDEFWIGDNTGLGIYQTVLLGRDGKGMPSWGMALGTGACKQLAALVVTMRGANLPGRPPQGERRPAPAAPAK